MGKEWILCDNSRWEKSGYYVIIVDGKRVDAKRVYVTYNSRWEKSGYYVIIVDGKRVYVT